MSNLILELVGTNHKFSDLKTREQLSFPGDKLDLYLKDIKRMEYVREVMILSTCNRVEIVTVSEKSVSDKIIKFLSDYSKIDIASLKNILYLKTQLDVVEHIFRVASSLDSMVVGEPQILGQIKDAYKWSVEFMTSGATINRIMRRAFHAAKVVKSKTDISKGAVSVAYAAMIKAKELFELKDKTIAVIGVGDMSRLACEHFNAAGARITFIVNRTKENAVKLAQSYNAEVVGLNEIDRVLDRVDVIITSTGADKPILTKDIIPRNKKLLIIDMAVPRDSQYGIEQLKNVTLILIDDLKDVVANTLRFRNSQVQLAEKIIKKEIEAYKEYVDSLDYDAIIKELRIMAERIKRVEINKFKKKYKDDIDDNVLIGVEKLTTALLNKILHEPTRNIKMFIEHPEGDMYIELLKRIFKIEHSKKDVKCFFSENS